MERLVCLDGLRVLIDCRHCFPSRGDSSQGESSGSAREVGNPLLRLVPLEWVDPTEGLAFRVESECKRVVVGLGDTNSM